MKTLNLKIASLGLLMLSLISGFNGMSQTAGSFTFTIIPVAHNGSYGAKHVVAVWIENSAGTFIKTKLNQSSRSTIDHLATWTSKSNSNVVDATTGATLTSYSPLTVKWDGTDVSKAIVADGDYKIWIEMAWDNSKTTGKTVTSFGFTKGTQAFHLAPANSDLFTNVVLDWVPASTGVGSIAQTNVVSVFPNPSKGLVNVDFESASAGCRIRVSDTNGSVVFDTEVSQGTTGIRTLDLRKFPNGVYLFKIINPYKMDDLAFKVILEK